MIIITLPNIIKGEAEAIIRLQSIDHSLIIHIRKPGVETERICEILNELRDRGADMSRLTIHYNQPLAERYSLRGIHVRLPELDSSMRAKGWRVSASAHSWAEVEKYGSMVDYMFLSPVFDSISKIGYSSNIDLDDAAQRISGLNMSCGIVALGGVDTTRMWQIRKAGFCCGAVLGALWECKKESSMSNAECIDIEVTTDNFLRLLRRERSAASEVQFISDGNLTTAEQFLMGGGHWIQLRMKGSSPEQVIERGRQMVDLCNSYGAVLIINDNPHIAEQTSAHGVHLGQSDISPPEARAILREGAIIGSTANTIDDIERLSSMPIDYIGLGPYRFTTTKSNLSPILGLEGYRRIIHTMSGRGIGIPVVAIGGIETEDVDQIMACGVSGIAVSGAISGARDVKAKTEKILRKIKNKG